MNVLTSIAQFLGPYAGVVLFLVLLIAFFVFSARKATGEPYVRLVYPALVNQILNPDSRKVGFGWALFLVATFGLFFARKANGDPIIDASTWLLCSTTSSMLIGGGTIMDDKHDLAMAALAAAAPAAPIVEPGKAA